MKEKLIKRVGLAAGGVIAAVAMACSPPGAKNTENTQAAPPTLPTASGEILRPPAQTPEATAVPTAAPTPEPTPVTTPEAKHEAPCQILPKEFCNPEVIELKYQGQTYKLLGFKLPEGTPLYSPKDGALHKGVANGELYVGSFGTVRSADNSFDFIGDIKFPNNLTVDVKTGNLIGTIQNTGIKNYGEYNLLIFTRRVRADGKGPETDTDILSRLFPEFSEMKPVRKIDKDGTPVKSNVGSGIYADGTPAPSK